MGLQPGPRMLCARCGQPARMGGALRPDQLQQLEAAAKTARFDLLVISKSHPGCLEQLYQLISPSLPFSTAAAAAAKLLVKLASGPATNKEAFAGQPLAVEALVALLSSSAVGAQAANALATLAEGHLGNQQLIGNCPGAVSSLVSLLKLNGSQEAAAKALARLSANDHFNRTAIGDAPGAIKGLVVLLGGPTITAQYAAATLRNIMASHPRNQAAVAATPAMAKLVGLLASSAFQVQAVAAGALRNLAAEHADIREAVGKSKGAISRLVQLLSSSKPSVKQAAAAALRNLACNSPSNQQLIAGTQDVMVSLVGLLGSKAAPGLQEAAAGVLCNLVNDNPVNQEKLRKTKGALPVLRELLLHSSTATREAAGKVLRLLATDKPRVTLVVREQGEDSPTEADSSDQGDGATADAAQEPPTAASPPINKEDASAVVSGACGLTDLVELLGSSNPAVQQAAATALWAVAHELPDGKLLVGATEGAIPRLVTLLTSSSNGSNAVQQAAVEALDSLVAEPLNQGRIRLVPGVVASLTQLLASSSAGVQQAAAGVLRSIGAEVPAYEVAGSGAPAAATMSADPPHASAQDHVTASLEAVSALQLELDAAKAAKEQLQQEWHEVVTTMQDMEQRLAAAKADRDAAVKQLESGKQTEALTGELAALLTKQRKAQQQLTQGMAGTQALMLQAEAAAREQQELVKQLQAASDVGRAAAAEKQMQATAAEVEDLRQQLAKASAQQELVCQQLAASQEQLLERQREAEVLQQQVAKASAQQEQTSRQLAASERQLLGRQRAVEALQQQLAQAKALPDRLAVALVAALSSNKEQQVVSAAAALGHLARAVDNGQTLVGAIAGAMAGLVGLLASSRAHMVQQAIVDALRCLTAGHSANQEQLREAVVGQQDVIMQLVLSAGTDNKSAAQELLTCLGIPANEVAAQAAAAATVQLEQVTAVLGSCMSLGKVAQRPQAVQQLLQLVCYKDQPEVQQQAAEVLGNLTAGPNSMWLLLEQQANLVDGLAQLLHSSSDKVQEQGASALARVAVSSKQQHDSQFKLEVVEALVQLLSSRNPKVQLAAANALQRIADGSKVAAQRIGAVPEAVPRLAQLLGARSASDVQAQAASTLKSLAEQSPASQTKIGAQQQTVTGLVDLLRSNSQGAQLASAKALGALTKDHGRNQHLVVETRGALSGLVGLMAVDNPAVQAAAAGATWRLVRKAPFDVMANVHNAGIMVPAVVGLLQSGSQQVQVAAAAAVWAMACACERHKATIGEHPQAIPQLVELLQSSDSRVVSRAAGALRSLAAGNKSNTSKIADTNGALELLVMCLHSNDPELQDDAAAAFNNILVHLPAVAHRIGSIQGLPGRVAELLHCGPMVVQQRVLYMVQLLSPCTTFVDQLLSTGTSGVLQQLVSLLSSSNMEVQERAALALHAVATAAPAKKEQIAAAAVDGLLRLLVADAGAAVTGAAVHALWGIAKDVPSARQAISRDTAACACLARLTKAGGNGLQPSASCLLALLLFTVCEPIGQHA